MRADANKIALRAIKSVLGGARPFEIAIGATTVACTTAPIPAQPWPTTIGGLDAIEDAPWPSGVTVECRWPEGSCRLTVDTYSWTSGTYLHDLCLRVRTQNREVVFVNVANELENVEDGASVKLGIRFFVTKRRAFVSDVFVSDEVIDILNAGLRETLAESQIPILGKNTAELCAVEAPSGELTPTADAVFRRLVQLALLKLDFIDRRRTSERGHPLVDLTQWLTPAQLQAAGSVDEDSDGSAEAPARHYWAGGFAEPARLDAFKAGNFWQIGWKRTSDKPAAKKTWAMFPAIKPGDYFAIKGLGGAHDLVIHYVGEVVAVEIDDGIVRLKPLAIPLYKGKGPTGSGAGNWQNTLLSVTRLDIVQQLFASTAGTAAKPAPADGGHADGIPANLILYGPPGTGKTYYLTSSLVERFRRAPTAADSMAELVDELTWAQVAALALHDLGGQSRVPVLEQHHLVKAKYAAKPLKAPLPTRLWATLQTHSVESSKTVNYKVRSGDAMFDKREDSTWVLAVPLPDDLQEIAKRLKPTSGAIIDDFKFITFHQAYGYEDFIEGIRPRVDEDDGEDAGGIAYSREDGAFMQAVRAALRLAHFEGSLDEFCTLTHDQRRQQFQGARHYAVFIDEINRGNVARIFGELISLLEEDKRLGADNEMIVTLPSSKKRFGVPPNLHVIGTMNTADRSIEALDTALRRRFEFRELSPRADLLDFDFEGDIELDKMLRAINRRLEKLYDRDHCIGHAYLYALRDAPTLDGLKRVFRTKLIPLLQEYFHGDWGKIGLVLGSDFVKRREPSTTKFAKFDHDDHEMLAERVTWELCDLDKLSNVAFQRIYSDVPDA